LARAKPGGDASGATAGAEKDAADTPDETQAFAASAADNETDPADIPDPADYEKSSSDGAVDTTPDTAAAQQLKASPAAAAAAAEPPVDGTTPAPNPLLIVGVPLLAAGILMAVYWGILRIGAV
jgi:hypothetical protein